MPAPQQTKVRFPRAKADRIVRKVEKHLKPFVDRQMACGSYRRGAQMIGDIDFVVIPKEGVTLPEMLPPNEGVNWVGDQKAQVIIDGEKVDFRVTTPEAWGATIMYFTGPADFNIKYRWMAKKRGMKLSEYGLFDRNTGAYIAGATEQDIYDAMGRPYRDPDQRTGWKRAESFEAPYQPDQTLADYTPQSLMTSSAITGDYTVDSLKYGFGPTALRAEEEGEINITKSDDPFLREQLALALDTWGDDYWWHKLQNWLGTNSSFMEDEEAKEWMWENAVYYSPNHPIAPPARWDPEMYQRQMKDTYGERAEEVIQQQQGEIVSPVIAIREYDGWDYLVSGHHRSASQWNAGKETIPTIILDMSAFYDEFGIDFLKDERWDVDYDAEEFRSENRWITNQITALLSQRALTLKQIIDELGIRGITVEANLNRNPMFSRIGRKIPAIWGLSNMNYSHRHPYNVITPAEARQQRLRLLFQKLNRNEIDWDDVEWSDSNPRKSVDENWGDDVEWSAEMPEDPHERCPICFDYIPSNANPGAHRGATSRYDDETEICSDCGMAESAVSAYEGSGVLRGRDVKPLTIPDSLTDPWARWCQKVLYFKRRVMS